ncbi:hypothetical protein VE03_03660 [Pseudogymnoascus sp. 23342-1-I1]|nr:hypothetical protein VE03_03593 [Pseudogymnoascus sp. 23342-1-I1]OBT66559.1 hypothetical protein VE03_03660 [Pseudogymnoascus sp. 23342-1-I1]
MCVIVDTVFGVCRHTVTHTSPCFAARHPNIPFTRCRPTSELDTPETICPSCCAVFAEADIDEYSASRIVGQLRRRESYSGPLIPRLGEQDIRMMDRYGAVFGLVIPRGTWWSDLGSGTRQESARRERQLQKQVMQPERPLPATIRPGSTWPLRPSSSQRPSSTQRPPSSQRPPTPPSTPSPQRPRRTRRSGYTASDRNSSLF